MKRIRPKNSDPTFLDDYTHIFDDFIITPKGATTKYGSYTDKHWNNYKLYSNWLKYHDQKTGKLTGEPGLELISPEFDIITGLRGILSQAVPKSTIRKYEKFTDKLWDTAYNKAIKSGNAEDVQRLRDLHFRIKSPNNKAIDAERNPVRTYHTVGDLYDPNFTEFNPNIEGSNSAIYTSNDPIMSGTYSSKLVSEQEQLALAEAMRLSELNNIENGYVGGGLADLRKAILSTPDRGREHLIRTTWLNQPILPLRLKQLYINMDNPVVINNLGRSWNNLNISDIAYNYPEVWKHIKPSGGILSNEYSTRSLEAALKAAGYYDGAIIRDIVDYGGSRKSTILDWTKPSDVYMVNSPSKLKLADPITYDNLGNVIPLSKRDNFSINDIRYGIVPTLFGTGMAKQTTE